MHTLAITTKTPRTALAAALVAAVAAPACGGKNATDLAAGAGAPPGGKRADRKVSKEAKAEFAQAAEFYREQAKTGWTESSCDAAAERFEEVADDFPKLIEARYNAGLSYHNCRMFEPAEEQYKAALEIGGHAPSLSNLGEIYWAGGNEDRARQYWEKAVQTNQKIAAARNNLAWLIIRKMRETDDRAALERYQEEAKGHLSRVLAVENDNIEAHVLYALLYMAGAEYNKSRLDLAALLLDEGEKIRQDYAPLYNARGLLLLERNNVSKALSMFRKAVKLDPDFVQARLNVANIVLDFRKYEEAAAEFENVLELRPESYEATVGLGIAQRGMSQLDQAEQSYNKAVQLDPSQGKAYYNLGVLYKDFRANNQEGNLEATQKAYKTARKYFRQYVGKKDATKAGRKEAKANIGDCDKIIRQLDKVIRQMKQQKAQSGGQKPRS